MAIDPTSLKRESFQPTWALIKRPPGFPQTPANGKIEMIFNTNSKSLYHRLSPYSNYDNGILDWGNQPFYWIYPDEANKGLAALRKYDSRIFPIGSAPIDIVRVTKFLATGKGVKFLATQFLLQTASPYNERRIYNPTSPIVAAANGLALGSIRPDRSFDTSGGLVGIASTLLGSAGSTIFGAPKTNPVSGTTLANNAEALPDINKTTGTKGLVRAGTAERAKSHLDLAWPATSQKGGFAGGFMNAVKGMVKSMFQNFIPQNQNGMEYRSDEGAYGMMLAAGVPRFNYVGTKDSSFTFGQLWYAGGKVMRKKDIKVSRPTRIYVKYNGGVHSYEQKEMSVGNEKYSSDLQDYIGYSPYISTIESNPGQRYGDAVGIGAMNDGESYTSSDIVFQYSYYMDKSQDFPTKSPDSKKDDSTKINARLKKTIDTLKKVSDGIYTIDASSDIILRSGDGSYDYNRLLETNKRGTSSKNLPKGILKAYRDSGVTMVDVSLGDNVEKSYKLPTNGQVDAINTLEVLNKDRKIKNSKLKGWNTWEPYRDDLIACFFYDVVNEKFIPFRASIKGLSESGNSSWEEMPFIGRADRVYSYSGFSRNATFTLKIVIGSLAEFAPSWQRINYICTAYKPANYTQGTYNKVIDRFMVPPMFMLNIGDMYRDQPILIQSITLTVPDDASWETYNQDNVGSEWSYLAKMIRSSNVKFGQMPREIDLTFSIILLEKERAVVGGSNFGHAPRNEDWSDWNYNAITNGNASFNEMDKQMVVDVLGSK